MKTAALTAILYGAFVAIGGIMGYVQKGSVPSIISGVACGVVLIACGLAMRKADAIPKIPWAIALFVTVCVLGRFGPAFFTKGGMWPNGTTALLSIAAIIGLVVGRK